jgi:hypothetical protein
MFSKDRHKYAGGGHRYSTGSVSDLSLDQDTSRSTLRSLTPLVYPQIKRCVFVPEGRWILAGGGAERNHRSWIKTVLRPGRDAGLECTA